MQIDRRDWPAISITPNRRDWPVDCSVENAILRFSKFACNGRSCNISRARSHVRITWYPLRSRCPKISLVDKSQELLSFVRSVAVYAVARGYSRSWWHLTLAAGHWILRSVPLHLHWKKGEEAFIVLSRSQVFYSDSERNIKWEKGWKKGMDRPWSFVWSTSRAIVARYVLVNGLSDYALCDNSLIFDLYSNVGLLNEQLRFERPAAFSVLVAFS